MKIQEWKIIVLIFSMFFASCTSSVMTGERIICPDCNAVIKDTVHQETVSQFKAKKYGIRETNERCSVCQTKFEQAEQVRLKAEEEARIKQAEIQTIKNSLKIDYNVYFGNAYRENVTINMSDFAKNKRFFQHHISFKPTIYVENVSGSPIKEFSLRFDNIPDFVFCNKNSAYILLQSETSARWIKQSEETSAELLTEKGTSVSRLLPGVRISLSTYFQLKENFPDGGKVEIGATVLYRGEVIEELRVPATTVWRN